MLLTVVGVAAAIAVFAGVVVWLVGGDSNAYVRGAGASEWDERVDDLVAFVEEERGLAFDYPVPIRFLEEDDYLDEFAEDAEALDILYTDDELDELHDADVAEYRALGLIEGELDLDELTESLIGLGSLAFYSPEDEVVVVRGTELTVGVRGTLVHELTHALQDQHFDLSRLTSAGEDESSDALVAFRTLVEGDASAVEDSWVATLSEAESDDYFAEQEENQVQAQSDLSEVPEVLEALFGAPYAIGYGWVEYLVALGGGTFVEVDARLATDLDELPGTVATFAPWDEPFQIEDNPGDPYDDDVEPNDELIAYQDTLGALSLFVLLSAHVPAVDALSAAELWRGGQIGRDVEDGRVCVYLTMASSEPDAFSEIINQWVAALLSETDGEVTFDGEVVWVWTCDPGADVDGGASLSVADALAAPATRVLIAAEALTYGSSEVEAACQGQAVIDELTASELQATELTPEMQRRITEAMFSC